ncbi:hypothetical protein LTR37_007907 [Vermiconidia calcicola]|uniref:Uncharacterized protein n=1 Tax=Vermiconidia calcicola TaxID=1690605 RepID=A0ACC3NDI1_9PEZI|nr:hypothetical protein LTR37_007907 [Vermiconidia calcicola]
MWQRWLEQRFPDYTQKTVTDKKADEKNQQPKTEKSLNHRNTAIKFALDQTIGATINTILFIAGIDFLRGRSLGTATADCKEQFWPLVFAGLKLWPMVSIFNFTMVPVEYRTVVGSVVGLFWGIYLSLISSSG